MQSEIESCALFRFLQKNVIIYSPAFKSVKNFIRIILSQTENPGFPELLVEFTQNEGSP